MICIINDLLKEYNTLIESFERETETLSTKLSIERMKDKLRFKYSRSKRNFEFNKMKEMSKIIATLKNITKRKSSMVGATLVVHENTKVLNVQTRKTKWGTRKIIDLVLEGMITQLEAKMVIDSI